MRVVCPERLGIFKWNLRNPPSPVFRIDCWSAEIQAMHSIQWFDRAILKVMNDSTLHWAFQFFFLDCIWILLQPILFLNGDKVSMHALDWEIANVLGTPFWGFQFKGWDQNIGTKRIQFKVTQNACNHSSSSLHGCDQNYNTWRRLLIVTLSALIPPLKKSSGMKI